MATKVAINGFGRIGRLVARAILSRTDHDLELVSINDLGDANANALLFKRDSVHGNWAGEVSVDGDFLVIDGKKIKVTLKEGIKWHDGKPLTPEDVCFTVDALLNNATNVTTN